MLRSCCLVFAFALCLSLSRFAPAQQERAVEKAKPGSRPLIQAEELKELLGGGRAICVLDVRGREAYEAAHLPAAAWVDVGSWKVHSLAKGGLSNQAFWNAELSKAGVRLGEPVVIVGESVTNAARAWWLLQYLGAQNARLLDGGMAAWKAAEGATQGGLSTSKTADVKVVFDSKILTTLREIADAQSGTDKCTIVDTRSEAEYVGQRVSGPRGGHLPGAVNLEWTEFIDARGRFLPVAEIRKVFEEASVDLSQPVVTHCQTGARSSVVALAAELAGCKDVRNFYCGWSEYSSATHLPVAK